jgi:hypothetical protein
MQQDLNFNNALEAIEAISNSFTVDAWVPSKEKFYSFKEIDAKQQKTLLSSAMNSSVYNTNFVKTFYSDKTWSGKNNLTIAQLNKMFA